MLAQKTSKYLVAAWQVTGEPKKKVAEAAVDQKVDPEMLERWIKFLARPPKHYSYLRDWQDMVKCGGTLEQAQFLADNFQNLVLSVARDAAALKEENDIIKAKAGVRKKPRRDAYPNEFETNDQFCPGCDLELKTMPIEPNQSVSGRVSRRTRIPRAIKSQIRVCCRCTIGRWSGIFRRKWPSMSRRCAPKSRR